MLKVNNLTKNFGKKVVLDNLTYSFEDGVYGLLGPNGAGKTTLMRCLTRLYNIDNNAITYNGISITKDKDYLTHVGYLPQKFGVFKDLKVFDMMQLFANFKKVDRKKAKKMIADSIEIVNLSDRINSRAGTLSGGMIRRLGIAQAILNNPDIIIFDEPTAGLDPEERLRFKNIISEIKKDKIIIISTHIVEDVEAICDKVAVIRSKNIAVSGSCREIQDIAQNKVFVIAEKDISIVKGKYSVQKQFEQDGKKMLKILTSTPQDLKPAVPNVEDGYICALKNI